MNNSRENGNSTERLRFFFFARARSCSCSYCSCSVQCRSVSVALQAARRSHCLLPGRLGRPPVSDTGAAGKGMGNGEQ